MQPMIPADTLDAVFTGMFYGGIVYMFVFAYKGIMSWLRKAPKKNNYSNSIRNYVLGGGKI